MKENKKNNIKKQDDVVIQPDNLKITITGKLKKIPVQGKEIKN